MEQRNHSNGEPNEQETLPFEVRPAQINKDGESNGLFGDERLKAVGTLIAIEADKSPNYLIQHFRVAVDAPSPKPGAMVAVQTQTESGLNCYILARVSNAWESNPHEDAQSAVLRDVLPVGSSYAAEGSSSVIYRVAEIEPLEEAVFHRDNSM